MPKNQVQTSIVIKGVDKFSKVMDKMTRKFPKLNKEIKKTNRSLGKTRGQVERISKSMSKFGSKTKGIGKSLSTNLSLPILGFGGLILNANKNFQEAFNKVEAKAKVQGKTFAELNKLARDLGSTTQFSATQAADAMAFLAQAGFKTNQIFEATPAVLNLAAASGEDLAFTADIMSNTMGAFNIKAKESSRVADIMAATLGGANVNMEQYADTMKFVAPIAAQASASLEDTSAAVGLLGNIGIQGSNAATALKNAFLGLAAPTSGASKVLKAVGIQVADAEGNMLPFVDIMQQLAENLQDLPQVTRIKVLNEVFGKRGIAGASELLNQSIKGNNNELKKFAMELKKSTGAAERMAKITRKGLPGALDRVKSSFEGVLLAIGVKGGVNGAMEILLDKISAFFQWVSNLNPTLLKWGSILLVVLAALGPVLAAIGFMAQGISVLLPLIFAFAKGFLFLKAVAVGIGKVLLAVLSPILAVKLAVVALVAGLVRLFFVWNKVKSAFESGQGIFDSLKKAGSVFLGFGGSNNAPTGANTKASEINQSPSQQNFVQTNNASVDINVKAPQGTEIKSSGVSNLNAAFTGLQGAAL